MAPTALPYQDPGNEATTLFLDTLERLQEYPVSQNEFRYLTPALDFSQPTYQAVYEDLFGSQDQGKSGESLELDVHKNPCYAEPRMVLSENNVLRARCGTQLLDPSHPF